MYRLFQSVYRRSRHLAAELVVTGHGEATGQHPPPPAGEGGAFEVCI